MQAVQGLEGLAGTVRMGEGDVGNAAADTTRSI